MSTEYSTKTSLQAPGMGFKADDETPCKVNRVCAHCGKPLVKRRPQTRYCNSTCQAAHWDKTHNRTSHAGKVGEL